MSELDLCVIICTRDRPDELARTISTLARQSWPGRWEVLLVDNGAKGGLEQGVATLEATLPVRLRCVREPHRGLSYARNRGLASATAPRCVFIDDDVNCAPGWLAAHADVLLREGVLATGGPIHPVLPEGASSWLAARLEFETGGPSARYEFGNEQVEIMEGGPIPFPFGGNMGVDREKALEIGGFRTDLGWGVRMIPSEETEFFGRLCRFEGELLYVPGAAVEHRVLARQTTRQYWNAWQRGFGRVSVLNNPPPTAVVRALRLCRECGRVCRSFIRARAKGDVGVGGATLSAERDLQRQIGRILELLRRSGCSSRPSSDP